VCHGKGSVPDPKYFGQLMAYCGMNGERSPHTTCPNCFGGKFVGTPDNDPLDPVMPNPLAGKTP
jgi:hypothetical protein